MTNEMAAEDFLAAGLTEPELQNELVALARRHGWLVHFTPDWMFNAAMCAIKKGRQKRGRAWPDPGFPDLALLHPERKIFLLFENKSAKGRVRQPQKVWLDGLRAAGVDARLVRPKNRDEIEAILKGEAA